MPEVEPQGRTSFRRQLTVSATLTDLDNGTTFRVDHTWSEITQEQAAAIDAIVGPNDGAICYGDGIDEPIDLFEFVRDN